MKKIIFENRIPKDYFLTKGKGESNITIHAGSYHLALKNAKIEMCNIIAYSSILPAIAREVKKPKLMHGSVMETIIATANCRKGKRATAGIMLGWLFEKKSNKKYGGLVCEYHGNLTTEKTKKQLRKSLNELYVNGYSKKYVLKNIKFISETLIAKKNFGTAIAAICFVNYELPIIK